MTNPPGRRLVTTALAALALGISEAGVRKLASRGKLTRHGTPQRARYDIDELTRLRHPDEDPNPPADPQACAGSTTHVTLQAGVESVHPSEPSL